jgi:hypothetical protein
MNYTDEQLLDALRTEYRVDEKGNQYWYLDGKVHRVDGPAIIRADGTKFWWLNGKVHRVDGPAVFWPDGRQDWYLNGKLHRVDGPAIIHSNGTQYWWLNGQHYTEEEYKNELLKRATT